MEPLLFSREEEEEPAGHVPTEGGDPGQEESLFPPGRRLDVRPQLLVEPGRRPLQRSPALMRTQSLEPLGGRMSRLSLGDALGMPWGCPWPGGLSHEGPCCWPSPCSGDDPAAGHPWRAPGISAGRSTAEARRGFARGGLLGDSSARSRGQSTTKPLGPRRQEPPALWGRCDVDGTEKEGAGSEQRAPARLSVSLGWQLGQCRRRREDQE